MRYQINTRDHGSGWVFHQQFDSLVETLHELDDLRGHPLNGCFMYQIINEKNEIYDEKTKKFIKRKQIKPAKSIFSKAEDQKIRKIINEEINKIIENKKIEVLFDRNNNEWENYLSWRN